jgi:hypothetical protein
MAARQKHISVPSSNSPPIPEWASPYWYVIRASALQASDKLTEEEAALLVAAFESYKITLPCQECRGHYVSDWAQWPFTLAHAKSTEAAMAWVEDMRIRTDKRVAEKIAAKGATAKATPTARAVAAPKAAPKAVAPPAVPAVKRTVAVPARRAVTTPVPQRALHPVADAMQRSLAIRSALKETSANRAGPRGCNCGRR